MADDCGARPHWAQGRRFWWFWLGREFLIIVVEDDPLGEIDIDVDIGRREGAVVFETQIDLEAPEAEALEVDAFLEKSSVRGIIGLNVPVISLCFFRSEEHTSELQSLMRISSAV